MQLIGNERNCYTLEKIDPALRTESKGVTQICSTAEGSKIISVVGQNEEILLEVTESQNKIVFLNSAEMKLAVKRNSDTEWWTLSCTFKLAKDAKKFYLETELEPENNHRMKVRSSFTRQLGQCATHLIARFLENFLLIVTTVCIRSETSSTACEMCPQKTQLAPMYNCTTNVFLRRTLQLVDNNYWQVS